MAASAFAPGAGGADANFHQLPALADPLAANDELLCYDLSAAAYRKTSPLTVLSLLRDYDTIRSQYADAGSVTVLAGGQAASADGLRLYTVEADTTVGFAAHLANGQTEQASTKYYLWIGEISNALAFRLSNDQSVAPAELAHPRCLRGLAYNDASRNLIPFYMANDMYYYDVAVALLGSDATEVLDVSVGTSAVDVNCSAFIPDGGDCQVLIATGITLSTVPAAWYLVGHEILPAKKAGWQTMWAERTIASQWFGYRLPIMVDATGKYSIKNAVAYVTRVSVLGFDLKR